MVDKLAGFRVVDGFLKIAGDALVEVACLSDINDGACVVFEEVAAWACREFGDATHTPRGPAGGWF